MGRSVYLDYCATTPVDADVRAAMLKTLSEDFGNPSSMHWAGRTAAKLTAEARGEISKGIGCLPDELYFTSGATEADNLALLGVMRCFEPGKAHLITTSIEHHAILHSARQLELEGFAVSYLPVDSQGLVDVKAVEAAICPETVLISVMLVNNEVGSIQPLAEIGEIAHQHSILVHTDSVQGLGLLDINVNALHVDLLSLSGHKIYGPKGIGALYVRSGVQIKPLFYGGSQEKALRPGTENIPGIVGLGMAVRRTLECKIQEKQRLQNLRMYLITKLKEIIPDVIINGPVEAVSPHVLSASFPGADGEMMLMRLSMAGIAVSMGSACTSKSIEPSHVLTSMGLPREQIEGTLRISFGYPTTQSDLDEFLDIIKNVYPLTVQ